MNKKSQQELNDNMQTCDDNHEKYKKQEVISEQNLFKLIDLSKRLESEEKERLQINIEIITKQMKFLYEPNF